MEPLRDAGEVRKAQKRDVEFVIAGGDTAKNLYALKEGFHQMARLAAVRVQDPLVLFAVAPAGDDDLHALTLCSLDILVVVICLVSQQRLGLQARPSVQPPVGSHGVALQSAQNAAGCLGASHTAWVLGIEAPTRDDDGLRTAGFSRPCRGLVRPAAGRIHHHFLHVGLLHALE